MGKRKFRKFLSYEGSIYVMKGVRYPKFLKLYKMNLRFLKYMDAEKQFYKIDILVHLKCLFNFQHELSYFKIR